MNNPLEAAKAELQRRNNMRAAQAELQSRSAPSQPPADMFIDPRTGAMTSRELLRNNVDTSQGGAATSGIMQGMSLGASDELMGAIGQIEGGPDMANLRREQARAIQEAQAEDFPKTTLATEIGGAVMSPAAKLGAGVNTVRGAAAVGAGFGAVDAFNRGEGGAAERFKVGAKGTVGGAIFGAASSKVVSGAARGIRRAFKKAEARPTLENMRSAKNAAYAAVRRSGVDFSEDEMLGAWSALDDLSKDARWDLDVISEVDKPAFDAMRVLERRAARGKPISLNNLDKTRQKLWDNYNKSGHPFVLEAISTIDGLITQKSEGNAIMTAAREANSKLAKAQLLENAFHKARLQTAGSGSGGNILNKYKQAVTSILTKPHEAKWFSTDEIAVMESFVMGETTENVLRRAGKMAPGGNGLMTALNVYAASVDPSLLAITAAASAAKAGADRSAMRGSERLLDAVSTGVIQKPAPRPRVGSAAVAGAAAGNRLFGF